MTHSAEHRRLEEHILAEADWRGRDTARINCPFCPVLAGKHDKRRSLGVSREGVYHCFKCGARGKVDTGLGPLYESSDQSVQDREATGLPEGFVRLDDPDIQKSIIGAPALEYLHSRGVDDQTISEAGLGIIPSSFWSGYIIVPVDVQDGVARGFVARDWTGTAEPRYRTPKGMPRALVFNAEAVEQEWHQDAALIVEGVFDALPYWPRAVALLGKGYDSQVVPLIKRARRPLAFCLDGDAKQLSWSYAAMARLEGREAGTVPLPPKTDPGEVDRDWLLQRANDCIHEEL